MSFYYLGLKKKTVENNHFFKNIIVLYGGNPNDICYEDIYNKKIDVDSNDISDVKEMCKFYDRMIDEIKLKDKDCKFIMYNQLTIEYMKNSKYVKCINDINLIKLLNDKPKCREILLNEITILDYKYLKAKDIKFENINKLFNNKYKRYVVQQPIGFAGIGTFLLDESDSILKNLNKDTIYSISGYIENAISLNNTFIISENHVHIFEGSYQNIKVGEELEYNGWNFELYKELDIKLKHKIYKQTLIIAKKLQQLGYRGVCGVDYLVYDENIYFMELNPRFQASSEYLDKQLLSKNLPSIFELNYLAFYNEDDFVKISNIINKEK